MNPKLFIVGWVLIVIGIALLILAPAIELAFRSQHDKITTVGNATGVVCVAPFFIPICIGYGTSTKITILAILLTLIVFIIVVLLMLWMIRKFTHTSTPGIEP